MKTPSITWILAAIVAIALWLFEMVRHPNVMFLIVPIIALLILMWFDMRGYEFADQLLRAIGAATLLIILPIGFPVLIILVANEIFGRVPGHYLNWAAIAVLPAGFGAYWFKRHSQRTYGMIEILIGLATAFGYTTRGQFGPTQGLALIGSMYVVARGFTNIADANKKAKADAEKKDAVVA